MDCKGNDNAYKQKHKNGKPALADDAQNSPDRHGSNEVSILLAWSSGCSSVHSAVLTVRLACTIIDRRARGSAVSGLRCPVIDWR